jgi:hypothetical protein
LSSFTCYDDTTSISLLINYSATSDFCQGGMHDTPYDTSTMASLMPSITTLRHAIGYVYLVFVSKEKYIFFAKAGCNSFAYIALMRLVS